ncbi:major facilitator family transporter [Legionella rubrilucens]|uniref:Major facilitator family transporter n=1 Tax=Legionella rubrilucens TaxID=458 RepID=A0A0W0XXP6_9GAMM|nr:MFS transporter [Legionella rubrilucens]KTD49043.1 major facilitator family transporter [Legionella rubrilucens]
MTASTLSSQEKKIILLASLGGALEFYDFIIYVIFAPIISRTFFPETDQLASLMSVYAIFAIGYVVRPLGGIAFSHFGDKYGRKKTFIFSVMLMAVPTFLIGLLPTYQQMGLLASLLLIAMRLLQGLSIGGEIPGALTFTCEHVNPRHRALACGIIFSFLNFGIFLGACISLLLNHLLNEQQLQAFGWRIPFLLGGLLGVFSFYIRRQMTESPLFIAFQHHEKKARIPLVEAITGYWPQILQGLALTALGAVMINLIFLYMPTYLSSILAYSKQQASGLTTLNLLFYSLLLIFTCWVADRVGRKQVLLIGSIGFMLGAYSLFTLLAYQTTAALLTALFILALLSSCIMVYPSFLVELFPTSVRYTGIAIAYNLAFACFGGVTPLIATYLIQRSGNVIAPSYYLMLSAALCTLAFLTIRKHEIIESEACPE